MTEKVPHPHPEKMGERQAGREEVCRELEWLDLRKRPSQAEDSRDVGAGGRGGEGGVEGPGPAQAGVLCTQAGRG